MDNTVAAMNRLEDMLGDALFNRMLPVILTDDGTEFADPELFEYRQDGTRRTHLFYCQPRCSDQKGVIEKNHEYIRYIVPPRHLSGRLDAGEGRLNDESHQQHKAARTGQQNADRSGHGAIWDRDNPEDGFNPDTTG